MNEEEQVRHLLEGAGPRPEVPPEDLARIKAAFRAEWEQHLGRREARRFPLSGRRLWALAASLLAALGLGWWLWSPGSSSAPVARVESAAGVARLTAGEEIRAGAELETGEGYAALRLAGGPSLRLDAGSRVRLLSESEVRLERGALYLDSEGAGFADAVAVHTPLGVVTDVGTQFEARLLGEGSALRVRVREGAVRVDGSGGSHQADAGTELTLRADGSATRQRIAAHGPAWSWVLRAAPPLAVEGLTLAEFLDRVSRETGWTIRYADPDLAESARTIVVHGDLGRLAPDQALEVVLPGAGLDHQVVDGVLVLRVRVPN